jgi:hypothetical protein
MDCSGFSSFYAEWHPLILKSEKCIWILFFVVQRFEEVPIECSKIPSLKTGLNIVNYFIYV